MDNCFGQYLRNARIAKGIGQRELARKLHISASYLNDIEHSKRPAPSGSFVDRLVVILDADCEKLNDLAGLSRKGIPPDIESYIMNKPEIYSLLRLLINLNFSCQNITELKNLVASKNYTAIIIAAGLGSRLGTLSKNTPKCMLELNGKSILQRQLDSYAENGVNKVSVVRGYEKDKINLENLTYYENTDYINNNILNSLFYAEPAISGNVIVSYSDIVFSPLIVERVMESNADISIVVDVDWRGRYLDRNDHPIAEAENVIFDANLSVLDIGKIMTVEGDVHGEFIGMIKFSPRGAEIFKRHFHRAKELFWDKPYQRAATFQTAYLTDILKDMTDLGVPIQTVIIEQGWQEIDTIEDFKKAKINHK